MYPVVSLRGKLSTVKVNFAQFEDFTFRTPTVRPELENPALSVIMDKTMLKVLATELPKGHSNAIIDSLKNYVTRKLGSSQVSINQSTSGG